MNRTCTSIAILLSFVVGTSLVRAQDGSSPDDRTPLIRSVGSALEAFDRGSALLRIAPDEALAEFRAARDGFQRVINTGIENAAIHYNLANTQLRLGEIGQAIASYRRALRFAPGDEQIKANLSFARSMIRDQIAPSGRKTLLKTLFFWHYSTSLNARLKTGLVSYGVFWLLLAIRSFTSGNYIRNAALIVLLAVLPLAASIATEVTQNKTLSHGVLISNDVVVRKGNGEGYDPQFSQPINEGVEFEVIERRGGWIHIELPDGNRGWIQRFQAELI